MDEWGSKDGAFDSEEAQCRGPLGRATSLGTLEDILQKAPDTGISLHRGPAFEEHEGALLFLQPFYLEELI